MKKITLLFFACIVTIASCTDKKGDPNPDGSEDPDKKEQTNPPAETLPEKIVMTSGGETDTYTIVYQDNTKKIDKITVTAGGSSTTYVYDDERIQKVYWGSENSEDYNSYSYDGSGRLTKDENFRSSGEDGVTQLTYSGNKTIVSGEGVGGMEIELSYDSGNLTGAVLSDEGTVAGEVAITYDDKNAPFKNVIGWKGIRYLVGAPLGDNIGFEDILGAGNNPLKLTGTFGGSNVEVNYVYEFSDSKNPKFPTKLTGTKKIGTAAAETFVATITYK